jgi:hypothetical protein
MPPKPRQCAQPVAVVQSLVRQHMSVAKEVPSQGRRRPGNKVCGAPMLRWRRCAVRYQGWLFVRQNRLISTRP